MELEMVFLVLQTEVALILSCHPNRHLSNKVQLSSPGFKNLMKGNVWLTQPSWNPPRHQLLPIVINYDFRIVNESMMSILQIKENKYRSLNLKWRSMDNIMWPMDWWKSPRNTKPDNYWQKITTHLFPFIHCWVA